MAEQALLRSLPNAGDKGDPVPPFCPLPLPHATATQPALPLQSSNLFCSSKCRLSCTMEISQFNQYVRAIRERFGGKKTESLLRELVLLALLSQERRQKAKFGGARLAAKSSGGGYLCISHLYGLLRWRGRDSEAPFSRCSDSVRLKLMG